MSTLKKQHLMNAIKTLIERDTEETSVIKRDKEKNCIYCHANYHWVLLASLERKIHRFMEAIKEYDMNDILDNITLNYNDAYGECCHGNKILSFGSESCFDDISWRFVQLCLKILLVLAQHPKDDKSTITDNQKPIANYYGVNDTKTIVALLDFVTVFGICQNLIPGVGLHYKAKNVLLPPPNISDVHFRKLLVVVKTLTRVLNEKCMRFIIFPKVSSDLLASLIQLRFAPLKLLKTFSCKTCVCSEAGGDGVCCKVLCKTERLWCDDRLRLLLDEVYQPVLVRDLLRLQKSFSVNGDKSHGWYSRKIGELLSGCLVRRDGVKMVIQGILDGCQTDTMTWKKYESIGKVISCVPSKFSNADAYYGVVCPQIIDLMMVESCEIYLGNGNQTHFIQVCMTTLKEMAAQHCEIVKNYLLQNMLKPLTSLIHTEAPCIEIEKNELLKSLCCLQMICSNANLKDTIVPIISDAIHPMFVLCLLVDWASPIRKLCWDILPTILSTMKVDFSLLVVNEFVFQGLDENLTRQKKESGLITVQIVSSSNGRDLNDEARENEIIASRILQDISIEERIGFTMDILKHNSLKELRGKTFIQLLSMLSNIHLKKSHSHGESKPGAVSQELLAIDRIAEELKYNIELVSFLSALLDVFGSSILQDTPQIIAFMKINLDRETLRYDGFSDDILRVDFHQQSVDMTLMLLSTLLGTEKLMSSDLSLLLELVPALEKVSVTHKIESSRRMAQDLKVFISTRGAVRPDDDQKLENNDPVQDDKSLYEEAMKDIVDPLLPTRGHALIMLTNLLNQRNKYALKNYKKLTEIFEGFMSHSDSYLFLSAIDGIIALADRNHRQILPLLCEKFALFHVKAHDITSVEIRLKLCEAIVKICQHCNEILPVYREVVLSSLMTGVKDAESSIRASSISALGDVCRILKYSIGSIVDEVTSCVYHVLLTDKAVEVRRSAVQLFAFLFKGLETNILKSLQHVILDIYRLLRNIYRIDSDEITRLHADNALSILHEILKESLLSSEKLEKKIEILPDQRY